MSIYTEPEWKDLQAALDQAISDIKEYTERYANEHEQPVSPQHSIITGWTTLVAVSWLSDKDDGSYDDDLLMYNSTNLNTYMHRGMLEEAVDLLQVWRDPEEDES